MSGLATCAGGIEVTEEERGARVTARDGFESESNERWMARDANPINGSA